MAPQLAHWNWLEKYGRTNSLLCLDVTWPMPRSNECLVERFVVLNKLKVQLIIIGNLSYLVHLSDRALDRPFREGWEAKNAIKSPVVGVQ